MKYFGYLLLFIAITTGLKFMLFPVHVSNSLTKTAYDAVDKTINADNAIYNYEWFKQKYEEISATKIQIDNIKVNLDQFKSDLGDRKNWTFEDKNEYSRLNTILLGQKNYLESLIADYNARTKMANRAIFQDSILPGFIDSATFILK